MSLLPKGTNFARTAMALAKANGKVLSAAKHAEEAYGPNSPVAGVLRSAALAGGLETGWGSQLADARQISTEFLELVRPMTIIGKLSNLRRVPANVRVTRQSGGVSVSWVGEARPKPVSEAAFDRTTVPTRKVAGIAVMSADLVRASTPDSENLVRLDLAAAASELTDTAFIDAANAGIANVAPASITHGVSPISSSGDLADDIERAFEAFTGRIETAAFVMAPRTAVKIGLRAGGRGVAADLGARGGQLAGLPVVTSEAVPQTSDGPQIVLVDAGGILLADEGASVTLAEHASVEMDTAPTNNQTASTVLVSLWQRGFVAFMVERSISWQVGRLGSVVIIEGASYPAAS